MYIGNILLLIMSIPMVGVFVKILRVRPGILAPITVLITMLGVYTVNNQVFDIFLVIVFGVWATSRRRPASSPARWCWRSCSARSSSSARQSLLIFGGDATGFFTRPISGTVLAAPSWSSRCHCCRRPTRAGTPGADQCPASATDTTLTRTRRSTPQTVLVGYLPTPEGDAAVDAGLREAALRGTRVVFVNSPRRGAPVDGHKIGDAAAAAPRRPGAGGGRGSRGAPPLHEDDLPRTLEEAGDRDRRRRLVIGIRHRSPVGKAHPRQRCPAHPARCVRARARREGRAPVRADSGASPPSLPRRPPAGPVAPGSPGSA